MTEINLNSSVIPANAGELQQALVIRTKTSGNALEKRKRVSIGLIKPSDEKYLTGESSDRDRIVTNVFYNIPGSAQPIEAGIDEYGYLYFNTENAALAPKDAVIRIICLVCTPLECVKSAINAHLHPAKGYIRARGAQQLHMQFGEEIEPVHIGELYTIGDPHPTLQNDNNNEDNKNGKKS